MAKSLEPNVTPPPVQVIGYLRVSSADQSADRQLDGIGLDFKFVDHASGKDAKRPELARLIAYARAGDTVVVHSMDRLARNLADLRGIVACLNDRGVTVQFVKENLTFNGESSPIAELLLNVLGAVAQFERDLIHERQREGIAIAKQRGIYKGRQPALSRSQASDAARRMGAGESPSKLAREYNVSRQTLYRYRASPMSLTIQQ